MLKLDVPPGTKLHVLVNMVISNLDARTPARADAGAALARALAALP